MYVPAAFREHRAELLGEAIARSGLGTLVTVGARGPVASHVPMLLEPGPGPHGTLIGHIARANDQWNDLAPGVEALAIFLGPDAYVTPSWYPSKQAHGRVVPTWNYVAVHAYGAISFFDDRARLLDVVTRLTQRHEGARSKPWAVSDAPADYIEAMLKAIVGFALPIARIEGKWKMSQNRDAGDRAGVAAGLAAEGRNEAAALVPLANQNRGQ